MTYYKFVLTLILKYLIIVVGQNNIFKDSSTNRNASDLTKTQTTNDSTSFYGAPKFRYSVTMFNYYKRKEFILLNVAVTHDVAYKICKTNYRGHLAKISTLSLAGFLADGLTETYLVNSSVWTAGQIERKGSKKFFWFRGNKKLKEVKPEIMKLIDTRNVTDRNDSYKFSDDRPFSKKIYNMSNIPHKYQVLGPGMECLTFDGRLVKSPRFRPTSCNELNSVLCQRHGRTHQHKKGSPHRKWIQIKNTYYKLFAKPLIWKAAKRSCARKNSFLATVSSFEDAQMLARYLMIGRPSLQYAWIGARYEGSNFAFIENNKSLSLSVGTDNFPPWRDGYSQRTWGCVILDRVSAVKATFVPAHCRRKQAYICNRLQNGRGILSKPIVDYDTNDKVDAIVGEIGYRIYKHFFSWDEARDKCNTFKHRYLGKLAEIRQKSIITDLLKVTMINKMPTKYVWIGGRYDMEKGVWNWDSDDKVISPEELQLVANETYVSDVEELNRCLNMEREDDKEFLFYGTRCDWGQYFVCMFPKQNLLNLQKEEDGSRK